MRKRIYSILLAIALLATIIPITVLAEDPPHTHDGYTAISTATELAALFTNGGSGYLTANITTDSNASRLIKAGKTVNLCLNGFVLTLGFNNNQNIGIEGNGVLNLYDCGTKTHKFSVGANGLWTLDETSGTETVTGGVITGGQGGGEIAGAVYMASGAQFNMYGGNIVGCKATRDGGGIMVCENATFNMNGGSITGNIAGTFGGGIKCDGTLNLNDGNITNNRSATDGAGVFIGKYSSFTMNKGTISGNTAAANGGGIFIDDSIFIMNGGTISGNTGNYGGGVCGLKDSNLEAEITMNGGTISGNTGNNFGGGVHANKITFNMSDGTISENTAPYGAGLDISNSGTFNMFNGSIDHNTADVVGGAINANGNINIYGGEIANNEANSHSGGICFSSGNITLGGTAKIINNVVGSTTSNVQIMSQNKITIGTEDYAPKSGMSVGITMQAPGRFTVSDEIARENTSYFSSDDPTYLVNCPDTISYLELAKAYQINNKMPMDDMRKNHGAIDVSTDIDEGITEAASGRTIFISANPDTGYECTDVNLISDTTVDLTPAGEGLYSFTMPANNVSISAKFEIKTYTVTYNANGHGTAPEAVTADYGSKLTKPANLTASGYTFGGWYTDEDCNTAWDFDNDTVTADTTLYAKWTVVPAPKPEPELEPISYRITEGANSIWVIAVGESPTFRSNAPFEKFSHVLLDGRKLHSSAYKGQSGSTIITLTPEFTAKLAPGKHTIEIVSTDGSASTVFYIDNDEIAQTDGSLFKEATMSSGFVGFAIVGLSAIFFELKKKKVK